MSKSFKFGLIFLVTILLLPITRMMFAESSLSSNLTDWLFSIFFQIVCLGIIPFVLYKLLITKKTSSFFVDTKIKSKISLSIIIYAITIGLCVYVLNIIISTYVQFLFKKAGFTYSSGVNTIFSSPEVLILEIATSAILPAVFEEVTNRGLLLNALTDIKRDSTKLILVGLLFGLVHQNVSQFVSAFIIGIILAQVALKARSIIPAMIIHFINNFLIIMSSYSEQTNDTYYNFLNNLFTIIISYPILTIIIVAFTIFGIYYGIREIDKLQKINHDKNELSSIHFSSHNINSTSKGEDIEDTNDFNYVFFNNNVSKNTDEYEARKPLNPLKKLYNHMPLIIAVTITTITTIFTFIWGLLR
ncbi:MAG: CPBP family intramembrane metalloprotease [Christensenellaceae bacterium]|jgi:membrane protease YdiL (CAAX protease family)|nr:CPBP family intramembrane metalloprotease [Christensenellaceae bacterium]